MLICGVKASHDGGVALLDGDRLVFSVEMEKLANNPRYSPLDPEQVDGVLRGFGVDPTEVDRFVVDGWVPVDGPAPHGSFVKLPVAPYMDGPGASDPLHRYQFAEYDFGGGTPGHYVSYHHASNHVAGSYVTSPFAARGEDALVLVWDGAMSPRLYRVDAAARTTEALGSVLPVLGNAFADFCASFEPFHSPGYQGQAMVTDVDKLLHHLSIAGKAMAYAALGTVSDGLYPVFDDLFGLGGAAEPDNEFVRPMHVGVEFAAGAELAARREELAPGLSNADIIASFQAYLGQRLLDRVAGFVDRHYTTRPNLALGGGCALNIKWNGQFRRSGCFADVWVPPFPNDAGAALGTAACELMVERGPVALDWDVFRGPDLVRSAHTPPGWEARPCDERGLAELLHTEGEPVVVLFGRAELGPRALGNRSILAPAVDPAMKDRLNEIKGRASYRPVAPICLTERAPEVFDPGTPDPYMLFEHDVRPQWVDRVPAVVHLDGSARLQTVDQGTASATATILAEYERCSGIPVLCNTSANYSGSGFFPDVASAAEWGGTRYIWSEGTLFTRPGGPRR